MKYLVAVSCLLFSMAVNAQFFFGGLVAQGSGDVAAGSESAGASQGEGTYGTYGAAGAVSGSAAQAGVNGPGINFTSSGVSGVLAGSTVGGGSTGAAGGASQAGAEGSASHYNAAGFVVAFPIPVLP